MKTQWTEKGRRAKDETLEMKYASSHMHIIYLELKKSSGHETSITSLKDYLVQPGYGITITCGDVKVVSDSRRNYFTVSSRQQGVFRMKKTDQIILKVLKTNKNIEFEKKYAEESIQRREKLAEMTVENFPNAKLGKDYGNRFDGRVAINAGKANIEFNVSLRQEDGCLFVGNNIHLKFNNGIDCQTFKLLEDLLKKL